MNELNKYLSEVARYDLLGAEGERALARQIAEADILAWTRLLSLAPAANLVADAVSEGLDHPALLDEVRHAAARGDRRALQEAAATAAVVLRAGDLERERFRAGVAVLEEIADSGEHPLAAHPDFDDYQAGVRAAERAASDARGAFVKANLRLVLLLARQYAGTKVPVPDLVQEGNLGLIKAVDRYDPAHGTRFSTYAGWWIRHMIRRAVANDSRTVRVPVHLQDKKQRTERVRRELTARLGRDPNENEVAQAAGIPEDKLEQIRMHSGSGALSLDRTIGLEDGQSWHDVFEDPDSQVQTPLDDIIERSRIDAVPELLADLTPREAEIIRKRFGMETGEGQSLREIAEQYGLTRERIRQIQNRALAKMRKRTAAARDS